jgi:hypothetical protein
MKKNIATPRLIAGIISEIEARKAIVICEFENKEFAGLASMLKLEQGEKSDDIFLSLTPCFESDVACEVVLIDSRIKFFLEFDQSRKKGTFSLPKSLEISDLRSSPRILLSKSTYPVEIKFSGGTILGFANDLSADHVSVTVERSEHSREIKVNETFEIVIRNRHGVSDIFFSRAVLVDANEVDRPKRNDISPVQIKYLAPHVSDVSLNGTVEILNAGLTGFSGKVLTKNAKQRPIIGLILSSPDLDLRFCAVRRTGDYYGFMIMGAGGESTEFSSWIRFLDTHVQKNIANVANSSEIASLLIESGFLKASRLKVFGSRPDAHITASTNNENPNLVRRFVTSDDGARLSKTVSLFRFTDRCWLLHEVAAGIHKMGTINAMYEQVIGNIREESRFLKGRPNFLGVYYNPNIEVVSQQWDNFNQKVGCNYYPTRLLTLKPKKDVNRAESALDITTSDELTLESKKDVASEFDTRTIEFLDFWSNGQASQKLNGYLRTLGPSHRSDLYVMRSRKSKDLFGLGYRIKTHYAANSTGVLNSLFLFLKTDITDSEIAELISGLEFEPSLLLGTSDVIFVFQKQPEGISTSPIFSNSREFRLMISDLGQVQELRNEN